MQPILSNDPDHAGLIVVGLGGSGITVLNHLLERFGADALDALGIRLVALDAIRDDPLRVIPPLETTVDVGEANDGFVIMPGDHLTVLRNIAAHRVTSPYITADEAAQRVQQPRVGESGFGRDPVAGALAFDAAPADLIDRVARQIESLAAPGKRPRHIVLVGGLAGGAGASMLSRVAANLKVRLKEREPTIWVIGVTAGPYEVHFKNDEVFDLRGRTVATTRELFLLPDGSAQLVFLADQRPGTRARNPIDGTLSSMATFIEMLGVATEAIHGRTSNWTTAILGDTARRERLGILGAAAVRAEPHLWLGFVAQETAAQVAGALNRTREGTAADARTAADGLIANFAPLHRAADIVADPSAVPAAIDPTVSDSATVLAALSGGSELPPDLTILPNAFGRGRASREDLINRTDGSINDDLARSHAWSVGENHLAAAQLRARLHDLIAETLAGSDADGLSLSADPDALVMLDMVLVRLGDLLSESSTRVAEGFDVLTADPDDHPVRRAEAARDAAEEVLPSETRPRNRAAYLTASDRLREARRWETGVADVRAGLDLLRDVVDRVRRPILSARAAITEAENAARQGAADERRVLVHRHRRDDTQIVPTPDDVSFERMRDLFHREGSPNRPVEEDVLADLHLQFLAAPDTDPSTWRFQVNYPPVPSFSDTPGAIEAASREQVLPLDHRLLPAMAATRFTGVVARLSIADQIGMELERVENLGPAAARLPDSEIAAALAPLFDELVAGARPAADISEATIDGREDRDPNVQVLTFRPNLAATGMTAIGTLVQRILDSGELGVLQGAVGVDWPVLSRITVSLRVADSRLTPLNDALAEYHARAETFHISRAARRAFELERIGVEMDLMPLRLLVPEVVQLLADEETLLAAGSLMALGQFDTIEDPARFDGPRQFAVTVLRRGDPVTKPIGVESDPGSAILAVLGEPTGAYATAVRTQWRRVWHELVDHHGAHGAQRLRRQAMRDLGSKFGDTELARDLHLALVLLVIERDDVSGSPPDAPAPAPRRSPLPSTPVMTIRGIPDGDPRLNPSVTTSGANGADPSGSAN